MEKVPQEPSVSAGKTRKKADSPKTAYLGFRLPEEEIQAIEAAAAAAGESVSEYVRKAIVLRQQKQIPLVPIVSVSYANPSMTMRVTDNKSSVSESEAKSVSLPQENYLPTILSND